MSHDRLSDTASAPTISNETSYHVGTLSYTRRGLIVLFAWMLWGDFCFTLMEAVVPSILPIKLKALGASNTIMALIMSTLPGVLNATICPWVSFWSDRYRSRWGRRIPFILSTLPFLSMFLILLGFSQQVGTWVHSLAFAKSGMFSATTITIFIIGVFTVGFNFFNMFVGSVYWYFFNDVVPRQCIGQFLGLFRMVGGLAGSLYSMLVFKYAESHMTLIFTAAGLLYFIGFGVMCLRVKEGNYPPPPEYVGGHQGFFAGIKTFCVECFSLRFYWFMFGMTTFSAMGGSAGFMNIFWFRDVGMTLEQVGWVSGITGVIGLCLTYPAGFVADKYHPLRVLLTMKLISVCMYPLYLGFLIFHMSPQTAFQYYFAISLVNLPAGILYSASAFPTEMRIFPKERFGQFCSAQAMIRSIGVIIGGVVAGVIFDLIKAHYAGSDFAYRWLPAWTLSFEILSFLCLVNVYRGWKRYGGLKSYSPPLPEKTDVLSEPIAGI